MKYMGSKRSLLMNGLGDLLHEEAANAKRFVDLFAGTGRVAWHVAEHVNVPVVASDLQEYSSALAGAVITRTSPLRPSRILDGWLLASRRSLVRSRTYRAARKLPLGPVTERFVERARKLCADVDGGPIWRAYGGHYFSPMQAAALDTLIHKLPSDPALRNVCRAALILAASRCAAAPGHTAQPFQPTPTALPYIGAAWSKDPIEICAEQGVALAARHALRRGQTLVCDANDLAAQVRSDDLVFIDPPYSSVHYSRFYHVLETVARGGCGPVEGVGRYPPPTERPRSLYSIKTEASDALHNLLATLSERGCSVIVTFPQASASNGIDGEKLIDAARSWFEVEARVLASRFSTLGGNNGNRSARRRSNELIMRMKPRHQ